MSDQEQNEVSIPKTPVMVGRDGVYVLSWTDLNIEIHVNRIRESHDHETKAEVLITSRRPAAPGHLKQGRINMTSTASRKSMERSLTERDPTVDWDAVLEQMCFAVLQAFRAGSPVQRIEKVDVAAQQRWLIDPLLQLNNPTLIYGPGSSGKSWLGQYIAVLADAGLSETGFDVDPCTGRVLYLDWETTQDEIAERVTKIRQGMNLPDSGNIWYKKMTSGLANDIESLREAVVDHNIALVIVDSLGSACMGEPESAEVVLRTFAALRSLNVTALCIDHTNKEGYLFGSVYKYNSARMVFEIKKSQEPDEDKLIFVLFHKKANNSKLIKERGFIMTFGDGAVTFERQDVRDTPLADQLRLVDRIANLLRDGAMTAQDIAEGLDKARSHVDKVLSNGVRDGRFVRLNDKTHRYANSAFEDVVGIDEDGWTTIS